MKIITWNSQGAFRKKIDSVINECPDILIIQECEHLDNLSLTERTKAPTDFIWVGENLHKGLGVLSFGGYRLQLLESYNKDIKIVAPFLVTGEDNNFILLAVWANNRTDPDGQYIEQVWKAINYYTELLKYENVVIVGDFNSNKIWDKKHKNGNHSAVVEKLASFGITSAYHGHFNQEQGEETQPTFFLQRKLNKPYHIDYCFLSASLSKKTKNVKVGIFENWITLSDHMPLILDVDMSSVG